MLGFQRLELGRMSIAAPRLGIMDQAFGRADMVLGRDILSRYRAWLSFPTRQFFITAAP